MKKKLLAGGMVYLVFAATPGWCLFDDYWWAQQIILVTKQLQQEIAIYEGIMGYKQLYDEVSAVVRNPGGIVNAVNSYLALADQVAVRAGVSSTDSRIQTLRGALTANRVIMAEMQSIRTLSSGNAAAYGSLLAQTQQSAQELQALERQRQVDSNRGRYADQSFSVNSQQARSHRWQ